MPKPKSRPQRWAEAVSRALDAVSELEDIRAEYEEWRDNLPENLSGSALYEKLDEVANLDLQGAIDTLDECTNVELPRGFGRD